MNVNEKLQLLETEIDELIQHYERGKDGDKKKAFALKMMAIFFAAMITVLLGLDGLSQFGKTWFRNIALVFGALITVINAYEAFFDHRSLWINQTVTFSRLHNLRREIRFYLVGAEEAEFDSEMAAKFKNRLNRIMHDALREWLKLRSEDATQTDDS